MIDLPFHLKLATKTFDLMQRQERCGVKFDVSAAEALVQRIDREMEEIRAEVEPKLPQRPLNKTDEKLYTPPKIQFKKNGEPSAACLKWFDAVEFDYDKDIYIARKNDANGRALFKGELPYHEPIIQSLPMELKNQQQMKDWLLGLGWNPSYWNVKKDTKGKPVRDERGKMIRTSPKFSENGNICPGLERLGNKVELIKQVTTWLSLRNRRSVLINEEKGTGWLSHPRLKYDGRLPAASSGLTNTKRQKHKIVANVPRPGSVLGEEFRSLFIPSEGMVFVGADASGLEARNEASRSYPYDGGVYAREILEGDIHAKNAVVFGTDRNGAKSPKYAITYGCSAPKLAGLLDVPTQRAQELIDDYWQTNFAVAKHKEALEQEWKKSGKKYITGIAGDKIVVRSPHSLLNCDLQNMGASIMDVAAWMLDNKIKKSGITAQRVVFYHDEFVVETFPEHTELLADMMVSSIVEAGKYLKLNVPLAAEAKVGMSWLEVH